jgi:hypothetical protein
MSGTDTDPVVGFVLSLLALVALALILPLILAFQALVFAGRTLTGLGERRRQLLEPRVQEELQRIAHERSAAIRDILAIRQRSERELRAIATGGEAAHE